ILYLHSFPTRRSSDLVSTNLPLAGITAANTTLQRLELVAYWRDADNNLWRATRMDPVTGAFVGDIIATGCSKFEARLIFADGTMHTHADASVPGRRYTDINAIQIVATLESDLTDLRINDGQPLQRTFTWQVQPRNLLYERNR